MAERRPIRVLPENVANQIAAGEVVERPASVVKELVENALDAGATRIEITVEGGGAKSIEVADNGCGMDREDALASLERQATSKIATADDITRIATFGFRGEAIPSIASVSRFALLTRPRGQDAATSLTVVGGAVEWVGEAARPLGTTVSVRDLFFNVPARRKFLRAAATELNRIRQTLTAIALANPAIAFRLRADARDLFALPAGDTVADRVRTLLGEALADALLPIHHTEGDITLSGFLSKPDFTGAGAPEQYVFVNRRPATAAQIQYALREAWPIRDRRPSVVLFIDLPPEEVDVNVHPAKREVRFRHGDRVIRAVQAAVTLALDARVTPAPEPHAAPPAAPPPRDIRPTAVPEAATVPPLSPIAPLPTPQMPRPRQGDLPFPRPATVAPYPVLRDPPVVTPPPTDPATPAAPPAPHPEAHPLPAGETLPWRWLRVADILEPGYWLVVTDRGYVTVDAKAAIERIFYERLAASAETVPTQPLLIPETLRLPHTDAARVTRFLPELTAAGFGVSALDHDTFLIDALPIALAELPPKETLALLAAELDQPGPRKGLDAWRREVVARAAAQAAGRAFRITSKEAVATLMAQLARCAMPYATPRGRPVMILTTYHELDRRFRRA